MFDYKIHITPDDYIHELEEKDCKDYLFIAPVGETLNNEMSDVYYQENAFVPYHEHSKGYETFSIDRGSVEVTINGKRSVAEAGDLIHIEPYMSHGFRFLEEGTIWRELFLGMDMYGGILEKQLIDRSYPEKLKDDAFMAGYRLKHHTKRLGEPEPEVVQKEGMPQIRPKGKGIACFAFDGIVCSQKVGRHETGGAKEIWEFAVFADVICDYDTQVIAQDVANRLKAPSPDHWFGTDAYGRDIFARVVHGARISIIIGLAATVGSVCISGILGSIAGYYGGRIDNAIMRVLDTFLAIPGELLAMAIVASLGPSMTNLLIAVTIARIPPFTRVIRSSILTVIDQDYIESAIASGARDSYIIVKHILPNAMGPIIIQATMGVGRMILTAAGMSFIGMGVQPPLPEWGSMLAEGRDFMRYSPYITLFPGLAIILTSLALNLLGDGLRDALDPKLKN